MYNMAVALVNAGRHDKVGAQPVRVRVGAHACEGGGGCRGEHCPLSRCAQAGVR